LDVKLRFLPGDVVFFRSCVLQHFIRATVGERSSLVFFSHSSPDTITQNAKFLEQDSPELKEAIESKQQKLAKQRAEVALRRIQMRTIFSNKRRRLD